jgi:hypothetical protein
VWWTACTHIRGRSQGWARQGECEAQWVVCTRSFIGRLVPQWVKENCYWKSIDWPGTTVSERELWDQSVQVTLLIHVRCYCSTWEQRSVCATIVTRGLVQSGTIGSQNKRNDWRRTRRPKDNKCYDPCVRTITFLSDSYFPPHTWLTSAFARGVWPDVTHT